MVSDAKSVASDVGETVAAIEGLRAIILGEDGEVEDRGPLARPGDAPVHQRRRDARSPGGFGDIELVKFDRGVGRLALGKLEIDGTHLDIAEQRARRVADERDVIIVARDLPADAVGRESGRESGRERVCQYV